MQDDPLRDRIAAADPTRDDDTIQPVTSASAQTLLEAIMSTDLDTPVTPERDDPPTIGDVRSLDERRPRWMKAALAVAAVAVVGVAGAAIGGAFDGSGDEPRVADELPVDDAPGDTPEPGDAVVELSAGDSDPALLSCMVPDATILAQVPTAFRGIVDSVDGEVVTLTVDRWYVGGDAPVVTITAPLGLEALIGSIDFVPGQPYLVSAWDGVVNYCGLSGAATPELQALYDAAFPG